MATEENLGSVKRFGARYGRKPKLKYAIIEKEQRALHKCPYCNAVKVKRLAVGIWHCRKCSSKFTGKAYSLTRKMALESESIPQEQTQEIFENAVE